MLGPYGPHPPLTTNGRTEDLDHLNVWLIKKECKYNNIAEIKLQKILGYDLRDETSFE